MKHPIISIIIATKNEEEAIAKVICSIPESIRKKSEILVVDNSNDYTPIIAKRLSAKVIIEKRKGKGRAMKTGAEKSKGNILIFLDGDGTDPPEYIPKMLKKLEKSDLVLGSRYSVKNFREDDQFTKIFGFTTAVVVKSFFNTVGFKTHGDPLAGFRAIRRTDWDKMKIESNDFTIETEINLKSMKMGFKVGEIHIPILPRGGGPLKSKFNFSPSSWMKVVDASLKYVNDERVRTKIIDLRNRYEKFLRRRTRTKVKRHRFN